MKAPPAQTNALNTNIWNKTKKMRLGLVKSEK